MGNASWYSYWLYIPSKSIFTFCEESPFRIYEYDCRDKMIYTFGASAMPIRDSYKIDDFYQIKKHASWSYKKNMWILE